MSRLSYNTAPYFDDYDSRKGFHKILFKPDNSVQVRELNQIQSIFKNQIQKFANHIFKDGSRVTNGRTSVTRCKFVVLNTLSNSAFLKEGNKIESVNTGYTGTILFTTTTSDGLTKIWYNKVANGIVNNFHNSDSIKIYDSGSSNTITFETNSTNSIGEGMIFTVDDGVFYHTGNFIENQRQFIVLDSYSNLNLSFKVGFDIIESIVNYSDDPSLLDNTLGYSNLGAPGADRQKLELKLVAKPIDDTSDTNFITLGQIINNEVVMLPQDSEYSEIMDMIAKRTFETNGNYYSKKFKINLSESFSYISNLNSDKYGNINDFIVKVTEGTGYIKGYRVDMIGSNTIVVPKARNTYSYPSFSSRIESRAKIYLKPYTGFKSLPVADGSDYINDYTVFDLYDDVIAAGVPTGNKIGTCLLSNCEYVSGTINSNAIYGYFIHKIELNSGKTIHDIKSVYNLAIKFAANKDSTLIDIDNSINSNLIFYTGIKDIASLRSINDPDSSRINLVIRKKLTGILDSNSAITFNASANESFAAFNSNTICYVVTGSTYTNIDVTNYITITTNKIIIDLPNSYSGYTIVLLHDTNKVNIQERIKTKTLYTYTKVLTEQDIVDLKSDTGLLLPHYDAINLTDVKLYAGSISTSYELKFLDFKILKNDTEYSYELSSIKTTDPNFTATAGQTLVASYYYYQHSDGDGFFTIDSYRSLLDDPNTYFDRRDIGVFISNTGKEYELASCLDFRRFSGEGSHHNYSLKSNSDIVTDISVYMGRKDIVCIHRSGNLVVKNGISDLNPVAPIVEDDDLLPIYELNIPPYTYSLSDIQIKDIETKRYTMKDIGRLETRLSNVEYYTILNTLEKSAADLMTKDNAGFDRFKNGFIVDTFKDFVAGDVNNIEFRASVSLLESEMKPSNISYNTKLELDLDNCVGLKIEDDIVTLDYDIELADNQPFATNDISLSVFNVYRKQGSLLLYPNKDIWVDKNLTDKNLAVDLTMGPSGNIVSKNWGDWSSSSYSTAPVTTQVSQTIIPAVAPSQAQVDKAKADLTFATADALKTPPAVLQGTPQQTVTNYQTAVTTITTNTRSGTEVKLANKTQSYKLSPAVSNVQVYNFVRAQTIRCAATGLWPNTKIYVFCDNSGGNEIKTSNITLLCNRVGVYPDINNLITDTNGNIVFDIKIPSGLFYAGNLKIRISDNIQNNYTQEDCFAEATFFSQGLNIGYTQDTLNIQSSYLTNRTISESNTSSSTSYSSSSTTAITGEIPTVIVNPTFVDIGTPPTLPVDPGTPPTIPTTPTVTIPPPVVVQPPQPISCPPGYSTYNYSTGGGSGLGVAMPVCVVDSITTPTTTTVTTPSYVNVDISSSGNIVNTPAPSNADIIFSTSRDSKGNWSTAISSDALYAAKTETSMIKDNFKSGIIIYINSASIVFGNEQQKLQLIKNLSTAVDNWSIEFLASAYQTWLDNGQSSKYIMDQLLKTYTSYKINWSN